MDNTAILPIIQTHNPDIIFNLDFSIGPLLIAIYNYYRALLPSAWGKVFPPIRIDKSLLQALIISHFGYSRIVSSNPAKCHLVRLSNKNTYTLSYTALHTWEELFRNTCAGSCYLRILPSNSLLPPCQLNTEKTAVLCSQTRTVTGSFCFPVSMSTCRHVSFYTYTARARDSLLCLYSATQSKAHFVTRTFRDHRPVLQTTAKHHCGKSSYLCQHSFPYCSRERNPSRPLCPHLSACSFS